MLRKARNYVFTSWQFALRKAKNRESLLRQHYVIIRLHCVYQEKGLFAYVTGTPEYNLAKFLDQIIKPYIRNQFMLDSTFHLLDKLKEFSPSSNQSMVSFDVVFLFTNVPLEETTNMLVNYVNKENNPSLPAFEKDFFAKLIRLATQGLFLYKDTL